MEGRYCFYFRCIITFLLAWLSYLHQMLDKCIHALLNVPRLVSCVVLLRYSIC